MPVTVAQLRAVGERPVALVTPYGRFEGSLVSAMLTPDSVHVLLVQGPDVMDRVVIDLDDISEIVER